MATKKKTVYVCTDCGYDTPKWQGKCPNCGAWNTMQEETITPTKSSDSRFSAANFGKPVRLSEITTASEERFDTGISELNRVLGGGMVKGSLILVSGEPGIGKSTLLLQTCANLCRTVSVLYVTGEESDTQIKMRARRLGVDENNLFIYPETQLDGILQAAEHSKPAVMIIDSVQTIFDPSVQSTPGSVTQVRECTMRLMQYAKTNTVSVILVGHVNKDGAIAGPKVLEHMVDTVVNFEGDRYIAYRMLRATKNRFGSTNEVGMFEMTDRGLMEIRNPSAAFLSGRPQDASGSCVVVALEGTRPILAEIQGLVTKSAYGASRRTASGVDYNKAVLMMAILEKRVGFMLNSYDAYVNVVGGLRLNEPAMDLGILLAIASSYLERAIPADLAVFGEVGLSGELRAVSGAQQRIREAQRLGFRKCMVPMGCKGNLGQIDDMEIIFVSDIKQAIQCSLTD